jgi:hypothetical protein
VGKVALLGEGSTHSPLSTEEIEKKLNVYHKGAKIWKMLIFCQVEPRPPFRYRRGGQDCMCVMWGFTCLHSHVYTCGAVHRHLVPASTWLPGDLIIAFYREALDTSICSRTRWPLLPRWRKKRT